MEDGSRSSYPQEPAGKPLSLLVRFLVPSVVDVFFITLLGVLIFTPLSVRLLGDAGIGWHIRTGQQILRTHTIPRVDSFSSTMNGKPWFAWEWLYDVAAGTAERAAGLNGVVLLTAVVIGLVFAATLHWLVLRGVDVILAVALTLLAVCAAMIHFLARPHVASWLATLIWFWILDVSEIECFASGPGKHRSERPSRLLWILPLLMAVWVNVHGGFVIAFPLLAIYGMSAVWEWSRCRGDGLEVLLRKLRAARRVRALLMVAVFSALATLLNPYGWRLHTHIYSYLSDRFLMNHIEEFQSPNFHGVAERCFAALVLLALVALGAKQPSLRLSAGLAVLFAVFSGLYASRNLPVASLLLVLVCGPLLPEIWRVCREKIFRRSKSQQTPEILAPTFSDRMSSVETSLRGHLWPLAFAAIACWIALHHGQFGNREVMHAHFDEHRFPVAAVDYLKANHVRGPILSPDYWGGYLIYRLYPEVQVVVDDRHDLYGAEFLKYYLRLIRVNGDWDNLLKQHDASCLLLPKGSPLANLLVETQSLKMLYTDDVAIAFTPERSSASHP